jgi:precorrin-6Y C5,15-methyltransferase (decarboxylating)
MEFFSIDEVDILPSPSILSLCCAKIGQNIKDVDVVSLHGRDFKSIIRYLQPNSKLFVLSHDKNTPIKIIKLLKDLNFERSLIYIFENVGRDDEKITKKIIKDCHNFSCANLNSIFIDFRASKDTNFYPNSVGLSDSLYKNDGQITKSEIRAVTISKLEPLNCSVMWDIGGGSGSISIEWSKITKDAKIFTIEQNKKRIGYISENIKKFGIKNITLLHESAPEILEILEKPDRIFIGGGLASDKGDKIINKSIDSLTQTGIIVANGVTAETENLLIGMYKVFGGELSKYAVSNLKKIGKLHAWDQQMNVTQWKYMKGSNAR